MDISTVNQHLVNAEYAVRGPIVIKSDELQENLKKHPEKYPFKKVIPCNIGNPQALLQQPIRFYRDVSALVTSPWMLDDEDIRRKFKPDVLRRAESMLEKIGHYNKTGAYTESLGYLWVRQNVADMMERRDGGVKADPKNIFLTDGASPGIKMILNVLMANEGDAVMIPIPQYPLYSASLSTFNGKPAPYYLDESKGWSLSIDELERAYKEATEAGKKIRALVVINPGNPTGQVLSKDVIRDICKFASEKKLVILADEVYQENVYLPGLEFTSFKSVVGKDFSDVMLASFHSVSKGVIGECGKRGGYMEVHNFDEDIKALLQKLASISLCPNIAGQILVDLMVNPPKEGDESYPEWKREYFGLFNSLTSRAKRLVAGVNGINGMTANDIEGSMYAFPSITLPAKFIAEAESLGRAPDAHWSLLLLEQAGIVVVPGSGFGQRDGTYHCRLTILPPEDLLDEVISGLKKFHESIMERYN
eukprot:TRINITY_DN12802_c0_g2_i1.p1 TRINITY_DN12802_c0_g2~~TRINITY_DN12802_c0_g2_i1.p1  ORF type:complete len:493 (+),score=117.67 TRINITY_DN12802_c0_g2_i1:49-1479(+)